jgi:hypothetical protein
MRDTTTCNNKVDNRKLLFDYFDDLVMNKIMEYITKENHRGLMELFINQGRRYQRLVKAYCFKSDSGKIYFFESDTWVMGDTVESAPLDPSFDTSQMKPYSISISGKPSDIVTMTHKVNQLLSDMDMTRRPVPINPIQQIVHPHIFAPYINQTERLNNLIKERDQMIEECNQIYKSSLYNHQFQQILLHLNNFI